MNDNINNIVSLCDFARLLSSNQRFKIIALLARGPMNIAALAQELNLPFDDVCHALYALRRCNCIERTGSGNPPIYRLTKRLRLIRHAGQTCLQAQADNGDILTLHHPALPGPTHPSSRTAYPA